MKKWFVVGGALAGLAVAVIPLSSAFRAAPHWPGPAESALLLTFGIILAGIGALAAWAGWWIIAVVQRGIRKK